MSDEERFLDEEDGQEASSDNVEVGKKVGFLPAIVIRILQIAIISIAGIILIATISYVIFNIMMEGKVGKTPQITSPEYSDQKELLQFYSGIKDIRGQTSDDPPKTFMASIDIGYPKEEKQSKVAVELGERQQQIRNIVLKYLASKPAAELSPKHAEVLEAELKQKINNLMIEKVEEVLFQEIQTF